MSALLPTAFSQRAGLLTSAWYAMVFLAIGAQVPYWPIWLRDWGLSQAEIGTYLGLAVVVRVFSATVMPAIADRFAIRRAMLAATALGGAALYVAHLWVETRPALLAATLCIALINAPLGMLGEALGVRAAAQHGFAYAHARAIGSLAFLAMNVALGPLITWYGSGVVLWAIAANLAFGAVFGAIHPGGGAPPGAGLDQSRFREALRLSAHPVFLAFALAISVAQASHSIFYIYGTLIWTSQGIGAGTIGLLWGFGVFSEILLMIGPGRWMVARIGPARSMAIAALAGLVRWSVMAFEPGLLVLWPLQSLHAVTYAFGHLGAIAFVAAAVPPRLQASAQGLYAGGIGGIAAAAVMLLGAQVSGGFGMAAAYWLAAAMSAVALAAAMWLARIWDGGRLVADQP